ncbi:MULTISPECIES: amino acid ABC transporter permease [Fictibacillus]|uniref:Cystine transporter permease n=1 Tax=Fictibacillus enclensis TaxID=1017270 RepID=A0A0V8JCB2_9BACL|nr:MULTISPECIES: amino acid ABC transporter permease [Fictibacillus]KSU84256.1 cystine transporter permease [Fictibacillus enclensis]RXZ00129.1 amino acid ABC transporter permease [Fictibacillus sp. S7]SCB75929.1 amino acid ABC transporter membrane protein, PAAT family (TC 3.A.1.3.-) [Fictibacillus enclensis]
MKGLLLTLQITVVSVLIGTIVGLLFAFFKLSNSKILNWIANVYIAIIRGTPLIVQIFFFYFGLAELGISSYWCATLGLALHNSAYIAEIFRGSIQSINKGQLEAGRSLGMSTALAMRRIVLPQAFRRALPPLGNQFIIGLKDSSLAAFISSSELFNVATTQGSRTFEEMTYLLIVAIYYLVLVLLFTLLVNKLEGKISGGDE